MAKFKERLVIVDAEQWFKGKNVEGVIEKKFVPTGNWHDRFDDHPDVYIESGRDKLQVSEGYWIVTNEDGKKWPCDPETFKRKYEPLND